MSISIVTGLGPRTGTSFVMTKAKQAGLPIHGEQFIPGLTVPKHNPDGYWETLTDPSQLNGCVVKLWFKMLYTVPTNNIGSVVVLERRNKLQQLHSMYKVFKDECTLNKSFLAFPDPSLLLLDVIHGTEDWLKQQTNIKVLRVYTEDISSNLDSIIQFLKKGLPWQ